MPDIYDILSKHFLNETTESEEALIKAFKKENSLEYSMLKKLWNRGDIKVKDFDSNRAWIKMTQKIQVASKSKIIKLSIYNQILKAAAVAAILIIGIFSTYYLISVLPDKQVVIASANITEKEKEITLSDGTIVWLNKNASLSFTKKFTEDERHVRLTGEAFFKVHRNTNKPFIITTSNSSIRVLGTSFNVNSDKTITKVIVATGKVKVSNSAGTKNVVITPGLSATVDGEEVESQEVINPNYLAWKTGKFSFQNTPLQQVLKDLNTYYNNIFVLNPSTEFDCKLTAEFNKAKIKNIIETIELTCDLKATQKEGTYFINK